ncbi:MAG TPA: hypothetical protein VFJ14_02580 [Nocardioidaceae bacterium]|nr:hypothetical protein [Nocardioidaceae bacterium]
MSNPGSRADHDKFCRVEGWSEVRNARGKAVQHHITYELRLSDGRVLRARVSRPANTKTYGSGLWGAILTDQLCVTEEQFWACVNDSELPNRGEDEDELAGNALPAQLVFQLIHVARIPEEQVAEMSLDEAVAAMTTYWSRPPR